MSSVSASGMLRLELVEDVRRVVSAAFSLGLQADSALSLQPQ